MKITISSKVIDEAGTENLIQVAYTNHDGRILRISEYMEMAGEHRPLSETIHYPDGAKNVHLYNEVGDVEKVIQYDEYGSEIPHPVEEHSIIKLHL